ncbi:MAG: tRNA-dihydrouridine synthase family protein [Bacteroidales bacterium]|nr:tRNA-dihydrouridine synthase family protein [Bacteroidales bacterium]
MQLVLAPMQGLTELLFRRAYHRAYPEAFGFAISPFLPLTAGNIRDAGKKVDDVWPEVNADSMPVVPQILGRDPEGFVALSLRLNELGYSEVNWNIGCPMRRIAAKHRGSGILPHPEEVRAFLDQVVPQLPLALSVKMRLGYYDENEIDAIIPILNEYPICRVTVHPRIGKQMYGGQPRIEKFAEVYPNFRHPVAYNGDIVTVADYARIRTRFPDIDQIMIGRGALLNPLLPIQIRQSYPADFQSADMPSLSVLPTVQDFILSLVEDILALNISEQAKIRKIKEYWCLLSRPLPYAEEQTRRVLHAADLAEIRNLILLMTK